MKNNTDNTDKILSSALENNRILERRFNHFAVALFILLSAVLLVTLLTRQMPYGMPGATLTAILLWKTMMTGQRIGTLSILIILVRLRENPAASKLRSEVHRFVGLAEVRLECAAAPAVERTPDSAAAPTMERAAASGVQGFDPESWEAKFNQEVWKTGPNGTVHNDSERNC